MRKIRFHTGVALAAAATLLLECSGGLPADDEARGGAGSGASGGKTTALGGAHPAGGDGAGMAGTSEPNPTAGGNAGATSVATGGAGHGAGGDTLQGGRAGLAGAAGEPSGGTVGSGGRREQSGGTTTSAGAAGLSGGGAGGQSACVGTATRDCRSANDNNCDDVPDNQESQCTVCRVGTTRACNTHPEDGKGLCKAGTQACVLARDNASVAFGACTGDVPPTTEACGPFQSDGATPTPDANCNGLAGDGDYKVAAGCAKAVAIPVGTVNLFAATHPGTVAVHSCVTACPLNGGSSVFSYIALKCNSSDTKDTILGYAVATRPANYAAVNVPASSCVHDGGSHGTDYNIQIPALTFYALP